MCKVRLLANRIFVTMNPFLHFSYSRFFEKNFNIELKYPVPSVNTVKLNIKNFREIASAIKKKKQSHMVL